MRAGHGMADRRLFVGRGGRGRGRPPSRRRNAHVRQARRVAFGQEQALLTPPRPPPGSRVALAAGHAPPPFALVEVEPHRHVEEGRAGSARRPAADQEEDVRAAPCGDPRGASSAHPRSRTGARSRSATRRTPSASPSQPGTKASTSARATATPRPSRTAATSEARLVLPDPDRPSTPTRTARPPRPTSRATRTATSSAASGGPSARSDGRARGERPAIRLTAEGGLRTADAGPRACPRDRSGGRPGRCCGRRL